MKTLFLCTLLLVFSSSAVADNADQLRCNAFGELAHTLMKARQLGAPMSDLMATNTKAAPELKEYADKLVLDAYSTPRYMTEKMQVQAQEDFRNKTELACYQSQRK